MRADEYLGSLAADLCDNLGYADLRADLEPLSVDASVAVPLGIITNELLTNAVKYGAVPGSRRLALSLSRRGDEEAALRVADGGRITSYNVCYTKLLRASQVLVALVVVMGATRVRAEGRDHGGTSAMLMPLRAPALAPSLTRFEELTTP